VRPAPLRTAKIDGLVDQLSITGASEYRREIARFRLVRPEAPHHGRSHLRATMSWAQALPTRHALRAGKIEMRLVLL